MASVFQTRPAQGDKHQQREPDHTLSVRIDGRVRSRNPASFGGGPELRNRFELLECRDEGFAQVPHRPRRKLLVIRRKIQIVNWLTQVPIHFPVGLNERAIE